MGREAIPWPTLVKLSPGNLRRTASNFLEEWEKSLTPPATEPSEGESGLRVKNLDEERHGEERQGEEEEVELLPVLEEDGLVSWRVRKTGQAVR